jgi:ribosomal protein L7/L12
MTIPYKNDNWIEEQSGIHKVSLLNAYKIVLNKIPDCAAIYVVGELRKTNQLTLAEAQSLIESLPSCIFINDDFGRVKKLANKLMELGCEIEFHKTTFRNPESA